jgi:uncharacterized protein (TIGR02246 family)
MPVRVAAVLDMSKIAGARGMRNRAATLTHSPRETMAMINRSMAVTVPLALALALACAGSTQLQPGDARAAVEQRQAGFIAALAARDADAVAAFFADDGAMHIAGRPAIEGRSAIRDFYENMFGFLAASGATPQATHVAAAGDMAFSLGSTTNVFRRPEGPVEYEGKYSLAWRNVEGDWSIILYSVSSNQP